MKKFPKPKFKRANKSTGLSAIGHCNSLRECYIKLGDEDIGWIGHNKENSIWQNDNEAASWHIWIYRKIGGNVKLKYRCNGNEESLDIVKQWVIDNIQVIYRHYAKDRADAKFIDLLEPINNLE